MDRYSSELKEFILKNCGGMTREAQGLLKYPYVVPGEPTCPFYSKALWDWDSWLVSIALGQVEQETGEQGRYLIYEQGCIRNFLDHMKDGIMPICITSEEIMERRLPGRGPYDDNMHKPVLAMHAASIVQRNRGDVSWVRPLLPQLEEFSNRYRESHMHASTGLAYWQDDFAVGVDNDPSVYYRPEKSCASIYLNSLLYREMLALGYLLELSGDMDHANRWRNYASDLADAVNTHCWDERDGTYYSVDLCLRPIDPSDWLHQGAPRTWDGILLRVDSWSSFLPMWAGIASAEQAGRMLLRYRDDRTFHCRYGIRTLSRLEKMYDLRASNNPSNWLGPVWGISNFMVFSGLHRYGFEEDARELCERTVELFGRDLEKNGCLHEYYHPDTGEPIVTCGFENWNFLVLNMIAYLEGDKFIDTF